ncbi:MAG: HEAT repeat domain-containing protein [Acidobacteria bacterium]|nr:HEAT repeat domain-containing protein [Acidobacteriota bacterium]
MPPTTCRACGNVPYDVSMATCPYCGASLLVARAGSCIGRLVVVVLLAVVLGAAAIYQLARVATQGHPPTPPAASPAAARATPAPAARPAGGAPKVTGNRSRVDILVPQLRSQDPEKRRRAAEELGKTHRQEAVAALVAALSDPEVAWTASHALAGMRLPDAEKALVSRLRSRRFAEVSGAAELFVRKGARDLDPLILEMLAETKDLYVAQAMMSSQNAKLVRAARDFAANVGLRPVPDGQGGWTWEQ